MITATRIPWERFTTPQAAYEWTKAAGSGLMLARSPRGCGWWVLQLQEDMTWASRLHATTTRLGLLAVTPEGIR